ncbi:tyrosine-protein phosphatase non-receptor type 18 isoform X6 [Bubalus bubalis]|uniref:tyrosine-protein phosphatase non-receptor type 18 isoform X6 n=1 Tax=Bubalus bubalis TaxID=89462 RepID=UPI001D12A23E|nr:tyrosine-protein phosphatase non-receptor type 18 isoform X6 [Bubalus bubalis]
MSRSLDAARSFLEQLEALGGRDGVVFAGEFSDIRARSAAWKTESVCSTEAGSRPENVRKNRYKDVLPYDQTRVILSLLQEEGHGDYINGNFIRGTDGSQAYIATQGPLPHTLLDFWRLIWEFGVKVILMACQEMENGRKKCERYWALQQEPLQVGPFCITLTREMWLNPDIKLRILQVTFQKKSRSVSHLQYMSWPDRGVPRNPDNVLTMVEEARHLQGSGPNPLCVHCSAGCGRTGVLCTVDYVRQLLLTQMIPPNFSLFSVVLEIRKQRPLAIQTEVSSTGSCTTQWLRCFSQRYRMPALVTRTSRRIVSHSTMTPSPSGLPRTRMPSPAHPAESLEASRCPGLRPSPWPTLTRLYRSVRPPRAPGQARARGHAARRTSHSTAR